MNTQEQEKPDLLNDQYDRLSDRLSEVLELLKLQSRHPMALLIAEALDEGMSPEKVALRLIEIEAPQDTLTRFFVSRFGPGSGSARQIIRRIGIALNACHNTVTTDDPDAQPDEKSWRIDNSKEIDDLDILARMLGVNTDTDL